LRYQLRIWRNQANGINRIWALKKYAESAAIYDAALKIQPNGPDYYNMACSWSLSGNKDKAFK
jgi:hypothetical protein